MTHVAPVWSGDRFRGMLATEVRLSALRSLVDRAGLDPSIVSYKVITGSATEGILEIAKNTSPDLIVLGSDRLNSDGTRLGSVAERVLQRANRSVLTLKASPKEKDTAGELKTSA